MSNSSALSTLDCMGNMVNEGSIVRVLHIPSSVFDALNTEEKAQIESMLGEELTVYEVDQYGHAWVEKWWHEDENHASSHSLALEPSDMEVVVNDRA